MAWDSSNHMYAISKTSNKLYVFTVTATAVIEVSSKSISAPFEMVVVSTKKAPSAAIQYETSLIGGQTVKGYVTIDTAGNTTVSVTGQAAKTTYTLQFCPAVNGSNNSKVPACFNVTTVTTDSSGNGSATAKFPKSGNWAGEFARNGGNIINTLQSGMFPGLSNQAYSATLLPETKVNGGVVVPNSNWPQSPLTSGSVNYANGAVQFTVTGTSPNTLFEPGQTLERYLDTSNSYAIGGFTTNGSGDGGTGVSLVNAGSDGGDMFEVDPAEYGIGFIGGFTIP